MLSSKYLIIIALIFALLILYYFYDEIKNVKKLYLPTYQKTMTLETKVDEQDKRINELYRRKVTKIDSPALSITYQSDMIGRGNLSAKYADLSEREAKDLLEKIRAEKKLQLTSKPMIVNSDFTSPSESKKKSSKDSIFESSGERILTKNPNMPSSDTFNVKITDLISNGKMYKKFQTNIPFESNHDLEYDSKLDRVLEGLSKNSLAKSDNLSKNVKSDSIFDETEIDRDVLRSISESIHAGDLPSETVLSDIPSSIGTGKKNRSKSKKFI